MTFQVPGMPGQDPRPPAPSLQTRVITCCGYICSQGVPAPWECPGCGKAHPLPEDA